MFWTSTGLLAYTQIGYPLALAVASALRRKDPGAQGLAPLPAEPAPRVALIVAAHDEQDVIAHRDSFQCDLAGLLFHGDQDFAVPSHLVARVP